MKKTFRNFTGIYFFYYFALSAIATFFAPYLTGIGFSGIQIGSITGTGALVGVVATPIWGNICDRIGKNRGILALLLVGSSVLSLVLLLKKEYLFILIVYALFYVLHNPIFAVMDSYALKFVSKFGGIRLWGSIGYAVGVFLTGIIVSKLGVHFIFYLYALCALTAAFFLNKITKSEKVATWENRSNQIKALLQNRKYILFLIASFFTQGPMIANNTYFSLLYTSVGGTIAGVGIVFMLFCLSEAPAMKLIERINREDLIEKAFIGLLIASTARWYLYSIEPPVYLLVASFLLHGIGNGAFIAISMTYISKVTKEENRVTAIALYSAVSVGLANMFCQYAGGIILDIDGPGGIYRAYAILGVIAILLFIRLKQMGKRKIVK